MIYSIYGQPGSGKTTLGKLLANSLATPHHIDGDIFRDIFHNTDYSKKGREHNIKTANAVATYLTEAYDQPVVMSIVNPYQYLRKELSQNTTTIEILLESDRDLRREHHCEDFEIGSPDLIINTDSPVDDTWHLLNDGIREVFAAP